jgi:leader peptidase (prepilin peptidase) / N-methyltransferase
MTMLEVFRVQPELFVVLATVVGLLVGSFLNVVIHRCPKMMEREWAEQCADLAHPEGAAQASPAKPQATYNLIVPRSACPKCGHKISALENIPVVSYLFLRGKCRGCGTPIGARYPAVELLTGVVTGFLAWKFGFGAAAVGAIVFAWGLIALAFIDFDTTYLPDKITLPLLWLGLLLNTAEVFTDLKSAVLGAVFGYLALWSVYWLFKLLTKKEGMGYGDFKLLAAIGAWAGWKMLLPTILISSVVGAVVGIGLMIAARLGRNVPMPFGPYLAMAGFIALVWGPQLVEAYLQRI